MDIKYMRILWLDKRIDELGIKIHGEKVWKRLKLSREWHLYH